MPTSRDHKRPRIGIVAHAVHDGGGQERALAELIRRIHADYDLVVFSSELSHDLRPLVTWRRIPVPRRPVPLRFVLFYAIAGLRVAREPLTLLHGNGAIVPQRLDVATIQFCYASFRSLAGTLALPEAPRLRRLNSAIANLVAILAERWSYRPGRTRLLAPVSKGVARELNRHYPGIPAVVAPNGVDSERFRPDEAVRTQVRLEQGVDQTTVVSLFVGGDWDRKGLPIAVAGLARAHASGRYTGELWVVGRGDEARIGSLARALGVERQIRFFGFRPDTERFYQAADVFVFPTAYEAFPLVALEAASSGLPLVVTPVNGVEELVGDSEAGLLAQRSAEMFGEALSLLASDAELREHLGAVARNRASYFTWDRSANVHLDAYRHLLDGMREEAR